jgi:hypothetical protein
MAQTVGYTVFRNWGHWSKSDGMNRQSESFIFPSVWIASDPEVDQVHNLLGIQKTLDTADLTS